MPEPREDDPLFMSDVHTHHLTWYGRMYFRHWQWHKGRLPSGRGGRWWTRKCNEGENK